MKISLSLAAACLCVTFLLAAEPQATPPATTEIAGPAINGREVTAFTLFKDKDPTSIGGIQVVIRKLDAKTQKYSVDILVGTRRMEKKDIYAGEPIVFYAPNQDQAQEFLVREVFDDRIEGRLTAPRPLPPALPQK